MKQRRVLVVDNQLLSSWALMGEKVQCSFLLLGSDVLREMLLPRFLEIYSLNERSKTVPKRGRYV